ncbi:diguanylate cyclase (GGDEF) domain-containing protein [Thermanaeromonas toyohensis ToBE]|uniref:Diguanylate cyclase (GGDEF) domain-containing protein n=2 Tax=Thermanaeromonas TaxID=202949 RepID=A0A1W1VDE9_9FIRM|nr:diguanylate cyclase (GGDEF) domain-containing protein [Thermanaeromonas toyohensis ToBE]
MEKKYIFTWRLSWLLVGIGAGFFALLGGRGLSLFYGLALAALHITAALLPPSLWQGRFWQRGLLYLTSLILGWLWFVSRRGYIGDEPSGPLLSPILFLATGAALFLDQPGEALILLLASLLPVYGLVLAAGAMKLVYHLPELGGWIALGLAAWALFHLLREQRELSIKQGEALKKLEREYRELKDRLAQAEYLAITDPLTELYNLRYFEQALEVWLKDLHSASRLAILMVDIDYFKEINDTFGHQVGNRVLVEVARLLKRQVREKDVVARYGGEEFALLLPGADRYRAQQVAERIRSAVASSVFALDMGLEVRLTVSIGIAAWPEDARDKGELIRQADAALYVAKTNGRNMIWPYYLVEKGKGETLGGLEQDGTLPE